MKEESSEIQLAASSNSAMKLIKQTTKEFLFDPIEELELMVDKRNPEDQEQLKLLLGKYLGYPSTQLAEIHSEAMKIGNFDLENKDQSKSKILEKNTQQSSTLESDRKACPCCGFVRQQDTIKICTAFDDIKNIGASTQLYFSTFKGLSVLLAIMGIVYCIYAIITNAIAAGASQNNLYSLDYITISLAAKEKNDTETNRLYYYIQCWIGLGVMLIWIIMMIGIKYFEIKNSLEYDADTSSCTDYSVVLEGVPVDLTKEQLQNQLNGYFTAVTEYRKTPEKKRKPFKVMKLNVGTPFYLNEDQLKDKGLQQTQKQIEEIKEKFVNWVEERKSRPTFSEPKEKRKQIYEQYEKLIKKKGELMSEEINQIKKKLQESNSGEVTTAFVTFETNIARDLMVQFNEVTLYSRFKGIFGDKNKFVLTRGEKIYNLDVQIAPEPEDIIWTNIGLNDCSTYGRKIFTYSFTLLLLGASFGIVYGLSKKQNDILADANPNDDTSRYLSIAISMVIAITNAIIGQVIKFLTIFERDYTSTYRQSSLAVKSILAQMINSILIPVIVARYIKQNIYEASGLVDNIFMMSFTMALVAPFVVLFNPANIMQKVMKCWKTRVSSKLTQNQRQHNSVHEGIQFEVGYEYIYVVNLFMFACFFVSLQPICVFIALIGYLLMYWIQKYCMFYRYKRPVPGTDFVNQTVWQIIHLGPLMYSLGSLTWSNFLPNGIPEKAIVPNLIALGFSVLLILVPFKAILMGCLFDEDSATLSKYQDLRITFSTEYDRVNPATHEEGVKEYMQFYEKYVEHYQKLDSEKKNQIDKKKRNNQQRGQLNQFNQAAHQIPNMGMFGQQSAGAVFASMFQQPQTLSPYQIIPQVMPSNAMPIHNQQPIMVRQSNHMGGPPIRQQPQIQPNPFGMMFGGGAMGGMGQMNGMGGMGGFGNPMAQFGMGMGPNPFGRMW